MLQHVIFCSTDPDWIHICQTPNLHPLPLAIVSTVNIPSYGATSEATDREDVIFVDLARIGQPLAAPQVRDLGLMYLAKSTCHSKYRLTTVTIRQC